MKGIVTDRYRQDGNILPKFLKKGDCMDSKIQGIEKMLKKRGYRITKGRREIIELFVKNKDNHYRVEEVYNSIKSKNISIPTVYRTIEILKKGGIIKETIIDNYKYYELQIFSKKSVHLHLKCIECGSVSDYLDKKSILNLLEEKTNIENKYDMLIYDIYTIFYGVCKNCRG